MSSDPTQPGPEWWKQPQEARPAPGFTPAQDYQDAQPTQRLPRDQGYQQEQRYRGNQDQQRTQRLPSQAYPAGQGHQEPPSRTRRRRRRWPVITVLVILVVLVAGDRAAKAYAENQMASQVQSSLELSGKPSVNIQGFPFLTQAAARDFRTVTVTASNETAGPGGQLEIASLAATLHGMHIHGTNSATIDQFNASALVTFTALASAGGVPQGITLSPDGPNTVKASVNILGFSASAVAQVTRAGPNQINVHVVDAAGVPTDVLGNLANFNVTIPKLPAGVTIQSVTVTQQGILITAAGHDTTVSK